MYTFSYMQGTPEHVTPELLEASKPTNLDANKQKLTEEELDAKYLVAQENTEKSALDFLKNVQGLPELSHALNTMNSYKDPISGEVNLGRVKQIVEEMNLDLGQAYGLIRDNGSYEGTPQKIVDEVFAKSSTLPPSIQAIYQKVATNYINEGIASIKK